MIINVMVLPRGMVDMTLILLLWQCDRPNYCSVVCSLFVMYLASPDVFVQGN